MNYFSFYLLFSTHLIFIFNLKFSFAYFQENGKKENETENELSKHRTTKSGTTRPNGSKPHG